MRILIAIALLALLPSCGALGALGGASRPLDVYELRPPANLPTTSGTPLQREVVVGLPVASGTIDTDRIMIRPDPYQAQYLPGARWGEEAPKMVQTLMVRSLSATGGLLYVGRDPLSSYGDYSIVTDLVDFQAEASGDEPPLVRIAMTVRILRERDVVVFASRNFAAEAVAAGTDADEVVAAFDAAMSEILAEFTPWAMARLGRPL
ncbi:hypothetical protein HKCCE2091_19500 [Rhodobacterales bacterium HKCCE2091]|nr:hypothetical protein [Rhodobacterales bacterium HKCCE2091]